MLDPNHCTTVLHNNFEAYVPQWLYSYTGRGGGRSLFLLGGYSLLLDHQEGGGETERRIPMLSTLPIKMPRTMSTSTMSLTRTPMYQHTHWSPHWPGHHVMYWPACQILHWQLHTTATNNTYWWKLKMTKSPKKKVDSNNTLFWNGITQQTLILTMTCRL